MLDHERRPKVAYAALQDACRSVLPMLEPRTGHVHVANEIRRPLAGAVVEVVLDGRSWRFEGDVPADSLTFVGRVDVSMETSFAEVTLTHPELQVRNTYGPPPMAVGPNAPV